MLKVLCPLDFSDVSLTACQYAAEFLRGVGGGTLELLHCVDVHGGATSFRKMNDLYEEIAQRELTELHSNLSDKFQDLTITHKIVIAQPARFVATYADKSNFDIVILGTKKITILKDMTIGSVADRIMQRSNTPLLIVPEDIVYKSIKKVVVALDKNIENIEEMIRPLIGILPVKNVKYSLVHVVNPAKGLMGVDIGVSLGLKGLDYSMENVPLEGNVAATLTKYRTTNQADVLCMMHRKRSWIGKIFHHSFTKTEMFKMNAPLMVVPG